MSIKLTKTLTDLNGTQLQFIPPQATESEYGGIKAKAKTTEANEVVIDSTSGKAYVDSYTKDETDISLAKKQDKLVAGDNITIADDGVTISSSGGGSTYTAGDGISISDDSVISVTYLDGDTLSYGDEVSY